MNTHDSGDKILDGKRSDASDSTLYGPPHSAAHAREHNEEMQTDTLISALRSMIENANSLHPSDASDMMEKEPSSDDRPTRAASPYKSSHLFIPRNARMTALPPQTLPALRHYFSAACLHRDVPALQHGLLQLTRVAMAAASAATDSAQVSPLRPAAGVCADTFVIAAREGWCEAMRLLWRALLLLYGRCGEREQHHVASEAEITTNDNMTSRSRMPVAGAEHVCVCGERCATFPCAETPSGRANVADALSEPAAASETPISPHEDSPVAAPGCAYLRGVRCLRCAASARTVLGRALVAACAGASSEAVQALLTARAPPDYKITDAAVVGGQDREDTGESTSGRAVAKLKSAPYEPDNFAFSPPLLVASARGSLGVVEALLAAGADVDARDGDGETALMRAVLHRRHSVAEALLRAGADVEATSAEGTSAVLLAVCGGDAEAVSRLLAARREAGASWRGGGGSLWHVGLGDRTLLMHASRGPRTEILRMLLENLRDDCEVMGSDSSAGSEKCSQRGGQ